MSESLRNRIYVGKLHYDVRDSDIKRFFKDYGKINDINLKNGYAFVDFEDHRDCDDAVYEMDGKELLGDRVSVEHCKGGRDRRDDRRGGGGGGGGRGDRGDGGGGGFSGGHGGGRDAASGRFKNSFSMYERPYNTKHRVIVEGISSSTDWRDLKDFFRRVAEVTFADAHRFQSGEGVADFRTREELRRAIKELDDCKLNGRRVRLVEDRPQSRSRSRSNSPRRSSKRSRSRSRSPRDKRSRSRESGGGARSRSRSPRRRGDSLRESDTFERSKSPSENRGGGGESVMDNVRDKE